jgi:hypothetical protein
MVVLYGLMTIILLRVPNRKSIRSSFGYPNPCREVVVKKVNFSRRKPMGIRLPWLLNLRIVPIMQLCNIPKKVCRFFIPILSTMMLFLCCRWAWLGLFQMDGCVVDIAVNKIVIKTILFWRCKSVAARFIKSSSCLSTNSVSI